MQIEVSNGEIVDKLTIIEIKLVNIENPIKRKNLLAEYEVLNMAVSKIISKDHSLYEKLYDTNAKLWAIEDACRDFETTHRFDHEFIETARSVYLTNDIRAAIKKEINVLTNSTLIEEKSYQ